MATLQYGYRNGILATECMDVMVRHNLGIIRQICKVIKHREEYLDCCQYCIPGLIRAIEKWEPERNLQFSTYCHPWIHQKLRRWQNNEQRTIRIAEHAVVKWHKLRRHYAILEVRLKRSPTDGELSEASGMSLELIDQIRTAHSIEPVSLHSSITGTDLYLSDSAITGTSESAENEYFSNLPDDGIMAKLMLLDDETRQMIVLHLGLSDDPPMTIQRVAMRYKEPGTVVRQKIEAGLEAIRRMYEAP